MSKRLDALVLTLAEFVIFVAANKFAVPAALILEKLNIEALVDVISSPFLDLIVEKLLFVIS